MKKILAVTCAILLMAVLIVSACKKKNPTSAEATSTPLATATFDQSLTTTFTPTITLTNTISPTMTQTLTQSPVCSSTPDFSPTVSATSTTTPVCTNQFGNYDDNYGYYLWNGYLIGSQFTVPSSVTVIATGVNIAFSNSDNAIIGIYADNSGSPGTLVGQTGVVSLASGWNIVQLQSAVTLTAGATYWFMSEGENSSSVIIDSGGVASSTIYSPFLWSNVSPIMPPNLSSITWTIESSTLGVEAAAVNCPWE